MSNWTYVMQLSRYNDYHHKLLLPGIYEIGYYRMGWFYPKYIGKAENRLLDRIQTYGRSLGRSSHNATIRALPAASFYKLHFRVMRVEAGPAAAEREGRMLVRHGYGQGTRYPWNGKYELRPLRDAGYTITDVRVRV